LCAFRWPCLSCLEQIDPDAAATIGSAVFNATGRRVRDMPITLDKLL
jgi:CO/xanthine dehydrogenase Mo-binding subunit